MEKGANGEELHENVIAKVQSKVSSEPKLVKLPSISCHLDKNPQRSGSDFKNLKDSTVSEHVSGISGTKLKQVSTVLPSISGAKESAHKTISSLSPGKESNSNKKKLCLQRSSLQIPPLTKSPTIFVTENGPMYKSETLLTVPGFKPTVQQTGSNAGVFEQNVPNHSNEKSSKLQESDIFRNNLNESLVSNVSQSKKEDRDRHGEEATKDEETVMAGKDSEMSYSCPRLGSMTESTILEEDVPVIVRRRGCTLRVKITSITDADLEEFERECVGAFFSVYVFL